MAGLLVVTGSNGFVGRNVVQQAAGRGLAVRGLVRSEKAAASVQRAGGQPVLVDTLQRDVLAPAFEGATAVIHLAQVGAESGGDTYDAVNVAGTRAVAAAAQRAGVERLVLLSGLGVAHYGMHRRTTTRYFLSKLQAETEAFSSHADVTVFRPSYILGAGDRLVSGLLRAFDAGVVEIPGDGTYRMQPAAVSDVADGLLTAAMGERPGHGNRRHRVFDLVGLEAVTYRAFLDRFAAAARALGRGSSCSITTIPLAEADRLAAEGGFQGMESDELDCMLCDEVGDAEPFAALLGRPPVDLDVALRVAIEGTATASPR